MLRWTLSILLAVLCMISSRAGESAIQEKANHLAKSGDFDGAIGILKEHLKTNSKDAGAYSLLARLQLYEGQADAGVSTLEDGLKHTGDDAELLEILARVFEQQGSDGPTVTHKRGTVTYSPSTDKAKEDAFKKERAEKALAAFRKLAAKRTDDHRAALKVAEILSALERHDEALKAWEQGGKDFPQEPQFPLGQAQALLSLKRDDEAVKFFQAAILLNPRLPEAHAALAKYYEQKDPKLALQSRQRADFYEWTPPFSSLKHSDANQAIFEMLSPDRGADLTEEQSAAIHKKRSAEIARLMQDTSGESSEFLAALCFNHMDCGAREDAMFVELGKRGAATASLLHKLLRNHQSTCTARGSALALATQKDPKVFEWLAWALPYDTRSIFHMDLATALDVLGDPRAVKLLVETMQPSKPLTNPAKDDDDPMMEREGRAEARCRAALALGAFDTPESRAALQEGLKNPDFNLYCQTALYRMKPDAKAGDELLAAFKAVAEGNRGAAFSVRRYLARTQPEFAKKLPEEQKEAETGIRVKVKKAEAK